MSRLSRTLIGCAIAYSGRVQVATAQPRVNNSIVWGNQAGTLSTGSLVVWNQGCRPCVYTVATNSCVEGGTVELGNINADPQFVRNPSPGPDGAWGTPDDDYGDLRLQPTSPCIDAGEPAFLPGGLDLGGHPRLLDGDLDGVLRVDMGAHEFGHVRLALTRPAPNQVDMAFTGTTGMPAAIVLGAPAASGFLLAPLGELYQDLTQPLLAAPVGNLPLALSFRLPSGSFDFVCQAVVVGGLGGNVSNPEILSSRP